MQEKNINEINRLYRQLDERKRNYSIIDFKPQDFQQPLLDAVKEKKGENNKYRFLLYQGGNGS